ncbi:PepSY domain-containing protein [Thiorhodovibrio winogradskyi]|uniref:PepSY domain-containing protein n=1 Tax=Thiorhodovibrio winogradskyi TaxID=77007 RepID=UPI002E28EE95|nr:PepSY domain-containing protein [Thiorhodovibrio winogradskyi]
MLRWTGGTSLLLMAALALASEDAEQVRTLTEQGRILPLEQLITEARKRKPGILIEAELDWEPEQGITIYELLMLGADGELWELEFDALTGELLELELEHEHD